jgi:hypothetical protein
MDKQDRNNHLASGIVTLWGEGGPGVEMTSLATHMNEIHCHLIFTLARVLVATVVSTLDAITKDHK